MATERPPYATRACVGCKEKKLRCIMNDGPPWTCTRCIQRNLKCVIPELRQRQRRKKANEQRIARLERDVDRVISMLPGSTSLGSAASSETQEVPRDDFAGPDKAFTDDVLNIVSAQRAERMVEEYREQFAPNCPFVVLAEDASFRSLQQTSPMLLLSILITACWKERTQMDALNRLFMQALSTKLLLRCDRDLDQLNGLLVYLNWLPLHMPPRTPQAYRFMSVAVSLAADYGITRRPGKGNHRLLNFESSNEVAKDLVAIDSEFWCPEAQRAYLGCYHMATWYSILTRKLSPMVYNDYLLTCAQYLADKKLVPSDAGLVFQLELTRETDKVYTLFNYAETHQTQHMTDEQIQIYMETFSEKMRSYRSRLPSLLAENPSQQIWPWLFEAFVREISLSGMSRSSDVSVFRLRLVVESLESTKKVFDAFLSIVPEEACSLPAAQWASLGYCLQLSAAMSLSLKMPGWDISMAHSILKFDTYVNALSSHCHRLLKMMSPRDPENDWFECLISRWDSMKNSYLGALEHHQNERLGPQQREGDGSESLATPTSTISAAAQTHMPPYSAGHSGDQLPVEQPVDQQQQPQMRTWPMNENFFTHNNSMELFDFAANVGSWMVPDIDFPWQGVAGF